MAACNLCGKKFRVEETFELELKMDMQTNEFYYECPDCCGQIKESERENNYEEERRERKLDRKARRATRDRKAFY